MKAAQMIIGGTIGLSGLLVVIGCFLRNFDKDSSNQSHLNFIEGSLWMIGGIIIFFL